MTNLKVEFIGEERFVSRGSTLTFGRLGDVSIDTNPDLPSVVGRFEHDCDLWWLLNHTTDVFLKVADRASASHMVIAPGCQAPIGFVEFFVSLEVGRAHYELTLQVDDLPMCVTAGDTRRGPLINLNPEQRLLLVALAEKALLGSSSDELPSNAAVAERLGWKITKLNRKLDHLCVKFDKFGVAGLRGSSQRLATRRRHILVGFCISSELLVADDLALLAELDGSVTR